jgi:hypothetical protein
MYIYLTESLETLYTYIIEKYFAKPYHSFTFTGQGIKGVVSGYRE